MTEDDHQRVVAQRAGRLDAVVAEAGGWSRSQVARWIRDGRVCVDGKTVDRPSSKIAVHAPVVVVVPAPTPDHAVPQDLGLDIRFEDADIAVVNKPAGMVVHPSAGHSQHTLVNGLLHQMTGLSGIGGTLRPGIVHRLDRGTSGLLVVAKNDDAHRSLAEQFAERRAGRTYVALCHGVSKQDEGIEAGWIGRHPKDRTRFASTGEAAGRFAETRWLCLARAKGVSLIACSLQTGRTHQIRVHMAERSHPIVGDTRYAPRRIKPPPKLARFIDADVERPFLHAWRLRLTHPRTREACSWEVAPPADMSAALHALAFALPATPLRFPDPNDGER